MKVTFVEAAVLIAAARGGSEQAAIHRARAVKVVTIYPEAR